MLLKQTSQLYVCGPLLITRQPRSVFQRFGKSIFFIGLGDATLRPLSPCANLHLALAAVSTRIEPRASFQNMHSIVGSSELSAQQ